MTFEKHKMHVKDLTCRFNLRRCLRYAIYFGYLFVLYLLISRLESAFPGVERSTPLQELSTDTIDDTVAVNRMVNNRHGTNTKTDDNNPEIDDDTDDDGGDDSNENALKFKHRKGQAKDNQKRGRHQKLKKQSKKQRHEPVDDADTDTVSDGDTVIPDDTSLAATDDDDTSTMREGTDAEPLTVTSPGKKHGTVRKNNNKFANRRNAEGDDDSESDPESDARDSESDPEHDLREDDSESDPEHDPRDDSESDPKHDPHDSERDPEHDAGDDKHSKNKSIKKKTHKKSKKIPYRRKIVDSDDTTDPETASDKKPAVARRKSPKQKGHGRFNHNSDESDPSDDDTDDDDDDVMTDPDADQDQLGDSWARTDDPSDTEISLFEPRKFNQLSLEFIDYYQKYTQDSLILEKIPETVTTIPKINFLPKLKNPCFFVKNDHMDALRGVADMQQRDFDVVPGLAIKCLPYFFICATEKSGTSDLYWRMEGHQDISFGIWKENYFLNGQPLRFHRRKMRFNLGGYFQVFNEGHNEIEQCYDNYQNGKQLPPEALLNVTCPHVICDSTPRYFHSDFGGLREPGQLPPHKIKHLLGNRPKLIMMFRNPTDRLLSDYRYFERQRGRANETSAEDFHLRAVSAERVFRKCVHKYSERQCVYKNNLTEFAKHERNVNFNNVYAMSRMTIGMYAVFLETWLPLFPRENFHIVMFEEYIKDPNKYIRTKIIPFLGLDDFDKDGEDYLQEMSHQIINRSPDKTKPRKMWQKTRQLLQKVYKPYNERLATLLKDDRFLRWNDT